jgi:pimeloyl-ACP methyl ester carboxylesterase
MIKGMTRETIKINGKKFVTYKGFVDVPENNDSITLKTIQLPIYVVKSSSMQPAEPIFVLDGGPGQSNISTTHNTALLVNHDYVRVGYRGVDGSIKLNSKKIAQAMEGLHNRLLSDESLNNLELKMKDYIAELNEKGIDLSHYTIMDVIEDMEYARKALGYNKINLLSVSYGTRVALLYSYKYPEVINRSILEGANPPGHFIWWPEKTDQIITIYDSLFKATNPANNIGSIKEAISISFQKIPKRWSCFMLDPDKIKATAFVLMFDKDNAVMAFDAFYRAAYKGDYSGLYLMQLAYDYILPGMFMWGDFFNKGLSADLQTDINYREVLRLNETTLGPNLSLLIWGSTALWPKFTIVDEYRKVRMSQTETLIISGNLDVSTPADYAKEELLPFLPNGHQVILKNMSHLDIGSCQIEAFRKFITLYFDTGIVDESVFLYEDIDFKTKKRLSTMAKTLYPILLIESLIKY